MVEAFVLDFFFGGGFVLYFFYVIYIDCYMKIVYS